MGEGIVQTVAGGVMGTGNEGDSWGYCIEGKAMGERDCSDLGWFNPEMPGHHPSPNSVDNTWWD